MVLVAPAHESRHLRKIQADRGFPRVPAVHQTDSVELRDVKGGGLEAATVGLGITEGTVEVDVLHGPGGALVDRLIHPCVPAHQRVHAFPLGHHEGVPVRVDLHEGLGPQVAHDPAVWVALRSDTADMVRGKGLAEGATVEDIHVLVLEPHQAGVIGLPRGTDGGVEDLLDEVPAAHLRRADDDLGFHLFHQREVDLGHSQEGLPHFLPVVLVGSFFVHPDPDRVTGVDEHPALSLLEGHEPGADQGVYVILVELASPATQPDAEGERAARLDLVDVRPDELDAAVLDLIFIGYHIYVDVALVPVFRPADFHVHVGLADLLSHPAWRNLDLHAIEQFIEFRGCLKHLSLG